MAIYWAPAVSITSPAELGTQGPVPTAATSLHICQASDGRILHTIALLGGPPEPSACSFSPDRTRLAFWGQLTARASPSVQAELMILDIATGDVVEWHHRQWGTPVPCACRHLLWGPTSAWLAATICPPLGYDSEADEQRRCLENRVRVCWRLFEAGLSRAPPQVCHRRCKWANFAHLASPK